MSASIDRKPFWRFSFAIFHTTFSRIFGSNLCRRFAISFPDSHFFITDNRQNRPKALTEITKTEI